MRHAVLNKSAAQTIDISEWLIQKPRPKPYCPICHQDLHPVGERSPEVSVHFAHYPHAKCPTSAATAQAYSIFQNMPRTTQAQAMVVKQYALDNIESIYLRCLKICPGLVRSEFLPLLDLANKFDIWSLQNFNALYLPYVLLCCGDLFPASKHRQHPCFFVLEPHATSPQFWHQPAGPKQRIWRVDAQTKAIDVFPMVLAEIEPWFRKQARTTLGLP
jgi:hypothetical protein